MGSDAVPREGWFRRRSARARRLSARVFFDGRVEIVVPLGVDEVVVDEFVARHRGWIEARLARLGPRLPSGRASLPPTEITLSAIGEHWSVRSLPLTGRARVRVVGRGILELTGAEDPSALAQALRRWLRERAEEVVAPRLAQRARDGGYRFSVLRWRCQRTRWGSCSSRGVIHLNLCALFQEPDVLDYLLCHELVHTRHMNHSAAYWAELARVCPDWRAQDRALRSGWQRVPAWMFS